MNVRSPLLQSIVPILTRVTFRTPIATPGVLLSDTFSLDLQRLIFNNATASQKTSIELADGVAGKSHDTACDGCDFIDSPCTNQSIGISPTDTISLTRAGHDVVMGMPGVGVGERVGATSDEPRKELPGREPAIDRLARRRSQHRDAQAMQWIHMTLCLSSARRTYPRRHPLIETETQIQADNTN